MTARSLAYVAHATGGSLTGRDGPWLRANIDTRTLRAGDLFVALQGQHRDGHEFLTQAQVSGAAGALVARPVAVDLPQIQVADTRRALGLLAADWRSRFPGPVIGLTGSNGKTTVKEMLRAILGEGGATLATEGNLNNDIGVPLTLLRLADERWAVIEMGANHAGEIAYLTGLALPNVGLITNAGPAHLEGFGSIEGVARAKGELFAGLPADAVAVIPADDSFAGLWAALAGSRRCVRFGLSMHADFRAEDLRGVGAGAEATMTFTLRTPAGDAPIRLAMSGQHNVRNALGAAAAAMTAGATLQQVQQGLARVRNVSGRLHRLPQIHGATLFDDSYNANPASVQAAIDFLAAQPGERWLVLGDMAELGPEAAQWHEHCGHQARVAGVQRLLCVGPLSRHAADAFGEGAEWAEDFRAAAARLQPELRAGVNVLFKGSRAAGLERLLALLGVAGTVH